MLMPLPEIPSVDLFFELLWYFLCLFLMHLEYLSSSLYLCCAQFLVYFLDDPNILLAWHNPLQIILYMAAKIISHAWHWDHGIQWFNPLLALHGSNQINLPQLLDVLPQLELNLPVWSDPMPFLCLLVTCLPLLDLVLHLFFSFSPSPVISNICFNIFSTS